jgi:dipeptidyl-peptidase-4
MIPARSPIPQRRGLLRAAAAALLASCLATPPSEAQLSGRALYDVLTPGRFTKTEGFAEARWIPDGSGVFVTERDSLAGSATFVRIDPETGKRSPLFSDEAVTRVNAAFARLGGTVTPGRFPFQSFTYALGGSAIRFVVGDQHYLYHIEGDSLRRLHRPPAPSSSSGQLVRGAIGGQPSRGSFSPDFRRFAYVKEHDLVVVNTTTGAETRLTRGGSEELMNGLTDWVYAEELRQVDAFSWSPDGARIAYLQFDERPVDRLPIVRYDGPDPRLETPRYPLAGRPNPIVRLFVADVSSGRAVEIETGASPHVYIVRPTWTSDGRALAFQRLNRRQNVLELLVADPTTGAARVILREEEPQYVTLHEDLRFTSDGRHFLWSSERSGYRHLYLYARDGREVRPLTSGDWPVVRIVGVDERGRWVYFLGKRNQGFETHLFRARLDRFEIQQLTKAAGTHTVSIDPTFRSFMDLHSGMTAPPTTRVYRVDGTLALEANRTDAAQLDGLRLEVPERVRVTAADERTALYGVLYKPAGFDRSKRYPLLVYVYGGPLGQLVRDVYEMDGRLQRLAQLGFVVWAVDNRGTPGRGKEFQAATYLKLGQVDLADQIAAVKELLQTRDYIDPARVGIYGASYGGYLALLALMRAPDVFRVGVAVSPVTDWRFYDSIFTERHMRTPEENPEGYRLGSVLESASRLEGRLLLVHGMQDDNVLLRNSTALVQRLVEAGKDFAMMFYPDQRHGYARASGSHKERLVVEYLLENLSPPAGEVAARQLPATSSDRRLISAGSRLTAACRPRSPCPP